MQPRICRYNHSKSQKWNRKRQNGWSPKWLNPKTEKPPQKKEVLAIPQTVPSKSMLYDARSSRETTQLCANPMMEPF